MPVVPIELRAYPCSRVPPEARRVLNQDLTAKIRLRGTYPVILDSSVFMGDSAGICAWRNTDPDGALHVRPLNSELGEDGHLRIVYLHELAHRLLKDVEGDLSGHFWTFAAMNGTLLRRTNSVNWLKIYDVSEEDPENWGWAIQRALDISAELAPLPLSAEECAEKIWRIWFDEQRQLNGW